MTEKAEVLKEEVRKMVTGAKEIPDILNLVITLQRLGLDNHYETEIDEQLSFVHNFDYGDKDLNLVSLRFYLLRKNGYHVPSDVFKSFKDEEGNFVLYDVKSLLSLYNAAYLRIPGEKVLDEAIVFTRSHLEVVLDSLEPTLADEVSLALQTPLFRRVRILETRTYIPIYEKEAARNDVILELAKLNFNLLQLIYCEELKTVTLWDEGAAELLPEYMKVLYLHLLKTFELCEDELGPNKSFRVFYLKELIKILVQANSQEIKWRDEHYFPNTIDEHLKISRATLGGFQVACSSFVGMGDIITKETKMTAYITILDDIMDTYSTTEEAMLLAEAIYRWDEGAAELLPEYMKIKILVQANSQEIKWRDEHYFPNTIDEHLKISRATLGGFQVACSSFVGMGDIITKEILDWLLTYPELLKCLSTIALLCNDIKSTEREQNGPHHASTVQCYMLQHRTTMNGACEKIKELIEDTWKDMMNLYLTPTERPKLIAKTVVDVTRTADYIYKKTDAFTFSHTIKDMIAMLYVEPTLSF
ncbi:unnamed protein product [Urochloa decumbens]|uniref:Uncharacterized protein n=1 Tax=Urochloa decumbens TaxID=240449 RepID=A0ABC9C076_9POAL